MARYVVGVDIGGTFTDLVCFDRDNGEARYAKVPSTPPEYIDGVMNALRKAGLVPSDLDTFKHGSTIATNSIIQRTGAKTGLVTTMGMRDVLAAGRANRPELFDLGWDPSPPLVPRRNVLTVTERVDYEGTVLEPIQEEDVRNAARLFNKRGIEAIAICFMNSFMNPTFERRTKEILEKECPGVFICASSDILPEIREFERTSTTVANAYLGPIVDRYLSNLMGQMREWGYSRDILVTHSGGGVMSCDSAREVPARICQSGPAGGVMGGMYIGKQAGFDNVITFDMGGTSADLSLVYRGKALMNTDWRVEFNIPINFPAIDLKAIGAGGGSIAWVDSGGMLRNGPQSAGALPGPACFDKGGSRATNTDANLVLGRLSPENFLGGDMAIREDLAVKAIQNDVAKFYSMSAEEAADAILRVANANMIYATRLISVQRGYDPRDFALVAFGGAGPLHAVELARELSIPTVVVPPFPGLTSASGVAWVDIRHDFLRPVLKRETDIQVDLLNQVYRELEQQAALALAKEGVGESYMELVRIADVRYYGQSTYLSIPVPGGILTAEFPDTIVRLFHDKHSREYGWTMPKTVAEVEIVNARIVGIGSTESLKQREYAEEGRAEDALKGSRRVYFKEAGGFVNASIYERSRLLAGSEIAGPAIVDQADSTTVLPPGASARVDRYHNLIVRV